MQVRDVLAARLNEAVTRVIRPIEEYDDGQITKETMCKQLSTTLASVIANSFDFGFNLGVAVEPGDLEEGELALDIDLEELPPSDEKEE